MLPLESDTQNCCRAGVQELRKLAGEKRKSGRVGKEEAGVGSQAVAKQEEGRIYFLEREATGADGPDKAGCTLAWVLCNEFPRTPVVATWNAAGKVVLGQFEINGVFYSYYMSLYTP
ncbi:hypothetical protein NDU88_002664 [Pleurodeles waltl]|uniref:Uncharacterized protein n=1 Tax=Pleurodeles waltl TaxID=8319 RepID=A0AAV7TLB2_PLEWA|nr:hypothetical protein NDU88_002664 [Pleurodeles waltl]